MQIVDTSAPVVAPETAQWALCIGCVVNLLLMVIWIITGGLDTPTMSVLLDFC